MTLEEAVDSIDRVFTDSVEAHRISDVEVGCFLSGGVDSSYVASYFGGQKAFTVGFDNGQHYNSRFGILIRHFRIFSNSRRQVFQSLNLKNRIKRAIQRSVSMET